MKISEILELSMVLDGEKFWEIFRYSYKGDADLDEEVCDYIDESLEDKGLLILYRNRQYKKTIKVIVNVDIVTQDSTSNTEKLIRKLGKQLSAYFGSKCRVDDFMLSGVSLITDIEVGSRSNVQGYLKVLKKMGKIKGFSLASYDGADSKIGFALESNSKSVDFMIFDLESLLKQRLENSDLDRQYIKEIVEDSTGILRVEIRLTKPKVIRSYTRESDTSDQIVAVSQECHNIFMAIFTQVIPFGDCYRQDKAIEILRKEVTDSALRRRMMRLLILVSQKKSLRLAQKEMKCRNVEIVMKAFSEINLSPITIGKRHGVKFLKNLYEYL